MKTMESLPKEIKDFIHENFPERVIQKFRVKENAKRTRYKLALKGGISLKFNKAKELIGIDSIFKLPDYIIPDEIQEYVAENCSDMEVTAWKKKRNLQKIELN